MSSSQKLLNGLSELGIQKMQEHLDYYIELVNKGDKSFSEALEELVENEKKNNQIRRENANVQVANFPFIKTESASTMRPRFKKAALPASSFVMSN